MDFDLNEDERALAEGIAGFLAGRVPIERAREGLTSELWAELGEAGVFSLLIDDFGWRSVAVVFEELGAACVPGPLVWSLLAAGIVDGAADGSVIVGGIAWPTDDEPTVVEFPENLDALLVVDGEGIFRTAVPNTIPSTWPLDPLTPVGLAAQLTRGDQIGSGSAARSLELGGALASAAFGVGLARRCTDMSVAYAMDRRQFDRPIASFQAIKHICADMAVRVEMARNAVHTAAVIMDEVGEGDPVRAISTAKLLGGEAAVLNGRAATQVHGGMGFTWEVDVHLYLKRAWVLETQFGSGEAHADAIASSLVGAATWAK